MLYLRKILDQFSKYEKENKLTTMYNIEIEGLRKKIQQRLKLLLIGVELTISGFLSLII